MLAKTILFPILTVTSVVKIKFQASTPDIHLTSNGRGPMSGMGGGLGMNGSSKSLAAGSTHPMLMRSTAGGRGPGDYGPGPPPSTRYAHPPRGLVHITVFLEKIIFQAKSFNSTLHKDTSQIVLFD